MPNGSIFYMPVHNLLLCYFLALYSIHCLVIIWVRNWFLADSGLIAAQCGTVDTCVQICISLYRPIHCGPQWIKFWKWTWRKPRPPLHLYMPNMCVFIYIYIYVLCVWHNEAGELLNGNRSRSQLSKFLSRWSEVSKRRREQSISSSCVYMLCYRFGWSNFSE